MRTVILSDLHGEAETLGCMLEELNFDPATEELVVLGDALDYGTSPAETYIALRNLAEQMEKRFVYIRGEHEQMLLDALLLTRGQIANGLLWKQNGGKETLASLQERRLPPGKTALWLKDHTRTWYECQDFIAVHADIADEVIWNNEPETFLWGNRCIEENNYAGKLTVFGHHRVEFPTYLDGSGVESRFHPNYGTWFQLPRTGAIALDTGCGEENGYLTAMIVENGMMRFERI
ncbi:metallophosphoesterase [Stomatobaculum longum]|uniref:metallophosphoesterase n=1 Tax=Stomatobaculum longum TaxID=796942 RepID=UPI0028EFA35B|nr:metallophosphoesterase [Stomatobaculum longum]